MNIKLNRNVKKLIQINKKHNKVLKLTLKEKKEKQ